MTKMNSKSPYLQGALLRGLSRDELEEQLTARVPKGRKTLREMKETDDRHGLMDVVFRVAALSQRGREINESLPDVFSVVPTECWETNVMGPPKNPRQVALELAGFDPNDWGVEAGRAVQRYWSKARMLVDQRFDRWRSRLVRRGHLAVYRFEDDRWDRHCSYTVIESREERLSGRVAEGIVDVMTSSFGKRWFPLDSMREFLEWWPLSVCRPGSGNLPHRYYTHVARAWVNPALKSVWNRKKTREVILDALHLVNEVAGVQYQARHLEGAIAWCKARGLLKVSWVADPSKRDLEKISALSHWGVKGVVHFVSKHYHREDQESPRHKWDWMRIGEWMRTPGWKKEIIQGLDEHLLTRDGEGRPNARLYMTWEVYHRRVPADVPEGFLNGQVSDLTRQEIKKVNLKAFNRLLKVTKVGRHSELERWIACFYLSKTFGQEATRLLDLITKKEMMRDREEPWHAAASLPKDVEWTKEKVQSFFRWASEPMCTDLSKLYMILGVWPEGFEKMTFSKALKVTEALLEISGMPSSATPVDLACKMAGLSSSQIEMYKESLDNAREKTESSIPAPTAGPVGSLVFERLVDGDPLGPLLGCTPLSNCCQNPWGAAKESAWHGYSSNIGAFWIIRNVVTNDIVAQSHVWRSEDTLVLDSLEYRLEHEKVLEEYGPELVRAAAESVLGRLGICRVHGGAGYRGEDTYTVVCPESHYRADSRHQVLLARGEVPAYPARPQIFSCGDLFDSMMRRAKSLAEED